MLLKDEFACLGVVTNSVEFARILNLPRRVLDLDNIPDVTHIFSKTGKLSYWPIQSAALIEAARADGLFAPIGVGNGKTLIALSLPEALDSKNAVILVKPDLKRQLERESKTFYGKHFHLPLDRITIVAYSELSSAKKATILDDISPDLIVADEAHSLRHRNSARTKRFLRYANEHPKCKFAFLSGTMTTRSILDYAHLIELALRKNSPLPSGYRELRDWAGAIDVNPEYRMLPGALRRLCEGNETIRDGFRRRLVSTEGVVATEHGSLGTSLVLRKLRPSMPSVIKKARNNLLKTWSLGGEEISSSMELARALKQISCGFYYRWDWPGDPDFEWLEARAQWNREVRLKLKSSIAGLDSPFLLAQAAERFRRWSASGYGTPKPEKAWDSTFWEGWRLVKDRKPPPTKAVWLSDFVVDAAIKWAKEQTKPAIVWYEWKAIGERIAEKGRFPLFGANTDASESCEQVIVASIRTQGTGKNLQHYCRNLFVSLPPNGTTFEQAVGRTHRPGQLSDEVIVDWFGHTTELENSMSKIIEDAEYMEKTTGQRQKVLYANQSNK